MLWITDEELPEAMKIDGVAKRIEMVRQKRNAPKSTSSKKAETTLINLEKQIALQKEKSL